MDRARHRMMLFGKAVPTLPDHAFAIWAAVLAFAGAPAAAQPDLTAVAGSWELSLDGANRSCRVMLAPDESPVGRVLRFPAGCRRALPILNRMGGWAAADADHIDLLDAQGAPMLRFAAQDDSMVAITAGGEVFRLERPQGFVQTIRLPPPPPLGVPQPTFVDPVKAPSLAAVPGTYVVDRYAEREVCRIALGRATVAASGHFEVRLLDGCRDRGLAAFDPVAWRYEAGRLTITARRGHEVTLISERDGWWRRDPEIGMTLILRKVTEP
jgi:hypothetical protein